MSMNVLVLNCGSSSIKYQLLDMSDSRVLATGLVERIGESRSRHQQTAYTGSSADAPEDDLKQSETIADHSAGIERIVEGLRRTGLLRDAEDLYGIGHRVVHGGETFREPTLLDDEVLETMRKQTWLAPLHNPANLLGIEVTRKLCPGVPQVAVFDTAFHHSLPEYAWRYALPYELSNQFGIRRYGFHGTSHQYVARKTAAFLDREPQDTTCIILHLGNGASVTAVRGGRSVETSMGMTPLEGLVMGTRCGDIDPAIVLQFAERCGYAPSSLDHMLNRESGLKGLCGSNDMREVLKRAAEGDARAELAIDIYCYRIRKYIGAYSAVLGRVDALVFTAGVGENAAEIRARSCRDLEMLGLILDPERNSQLSSEPRAVHKSDSRVAILVIPTNEELEIAEQTVARIRQSSEK